MSMNREAAWPHEGNRGDRHFRQLLGKLPAGAYTCDPEGLITYFNERAVQLWGRAPKLFHPDDRYCGSFRLFATDGDTVAPAPSAGAVDRHSEV